MCYLSFDITRKLSLTILLLIALHFNGWAQQNNNFELLADPAYSYADSIKQRVTEVVLRINNDDQWTDIDLHGDHPAIGILNQLVDKHDIKSIRPATEIYLIKNRDNTYQVCDLYVKIAQTDTLESRQMMLQFNEKAQLIGARLASGIHNYQQVLDRAINPNQAKVKEVEKLVERFQQGLLANDVETIQSLLSNDAHIMEGSIVRYQHDGQYGPYFHYQTVSHQQFIQEIKNATTTASIQYEQPEVYRHTFYDDVYVATFKQSWQKNTYQDTGYVAIVADLDEDEPIQLRRWQANPFKIGQLKYELGQQELASPQLVSKIGEITEFTPISVPIQHKQEIKKSSFWKTGKNRWLIVAGTTAVISAGIAIIGAEEEGSLPGPPGRPAFR